MERHETKQKKIDRTPHVDFCSPLPSSIGFCFISISSSHSVVAVCLTLFGSNRPR